MTDRSADEVREPAVAYDERNSGTLPIGGPEIARSAVERLADGGERS